MALDHGIPLSIGRNALDERTETLDRTIKEDVDGYYPKDDGEATADIEHSVVKTEHRRFDTEGGRLIYHFDGEKSLSLFSLDIAKARVN